MKNYIVLEAKYTDSTNDRSIISVEDFNKISARNFQLSGNDAADLFWNNELRNLEVVNFKVIESKERKKLEEDFGYKFKFTNSPIESPNNEKILKSIGFN